MGPRWRVRARLQLLFAADPFPHGCLGCDLPLDHHRLFWLVAAGTDSEPDDASDPMGT
jgi:hypothetical protein